LYKKYGCGKIPTAVFFGKRGSFPEINRLERVLIFPLGAQQIPRRYKYSRGKKPFAQYSFSG